MPHKPLLIRGKGATKDEKKKHRYGEGVFITDYILSWRKSMRWTWEPSEQRLRYKSCETSTDAYRKTQGLIGVVEELEIKLERKMRTRIAESSPEDDEDTITTDGDTANSDGNVDMGGFLAASAPKTKQLILNPLKLENPLSIWNVRAIRLRLNQPKREDFEERPLPVNQRTETNPLKRDEVDDDSHRALSDRVRKALAKAKQ